MENSKAQVRQTVMVIVIGLLLSVAGCLPHAEVDSLDQAQKIGSASTALGSVTLTWTPPTLNTDGTPLTDLAGYRIYWGDRSGSYTRSATLDNPGLSAYVVENLSPGTWYFASTAINAAGIESRYSNEAVKNVL